jgi:hypothetical protein
LQYINGVKGSKKMIAAYCGSFDVLEGMLIPG